MPKRAIILLFLLMTLPLVAKDSSTVVGPQCLAEKFTRLLTTVFRSPIGRKATLGRSPSNIQMVPKRYRRLLVRAQIEDGEYVEKVWKPRQRPSVSRASRFALQRSAFNNLPPPILYRYTTEELKSLPIGTVLYDLTGKEVVVGKHRMYLNKRFEGFSFYGIRAEQFDVDPHVRVYEHVGLRELTVRPVPDNPQVAFFPFTYRQFRELPDGAPLYDHFRNRYTKGIDEFAIPEDEKALDDFMEVGLVPISGVNRTPSPELRFDLRAAETVPTSDGGERVFYHLTYAQMRGLNSGDIVCLADGKCHAFGTNVSKDSEMFYRWEKDRYFSEYGYWSDQIDDATQVIQDTVRVWPIQDFLGFKELLQTGQSHMGSRAYRIYLSELHGDDYARFWEIFFSAVRRSELREEEIATAAMQRMSIDNTKKLFQTFASGEIDKARSLMLEMSTDEDLPDEFLAYFLENYRNSEFFGGMNFAYDGKTLEDKIGVEFMSPHRADSVRLKLSEAYSSPGEEEYAKFMALKVRAAQSNPSAFPSRDAVIKSSSTMQRPGSVNHVLENYDMHIRFFLENYDFWAYHPTTRDKIFEVTIRRHKDYDGYVQHFERRGQIQIWHMIRAFREAFYRNRRSVDAETALFMKELLEEVKRANPVILKIFRNQIGQLHEQNKEFVDYAQAALK